MPPTYWQGINQCRVYMQAITFSDIATFDGTQIPDSVFQLKEPYRSSRLLFPSQKRPPHKSREQWQYFVRYISDNRGKLYTNLGKWTRKPYQIFPYIFDSVNKLLYKRVGRRWEIFEICQGTRNIYLSTRTMKDQTPKEWMPVKVICLSNNAIKVIIPTEEHSYSSSTTISEVGKFEEDYKKAVIGKFDINDTELQVLSHLWKTQKVELVCGSDGGLKNQIVTSGYIICMCLSAAPVIWRYAAEKQGTAETSSTRQELLAQLSIEYWIAHLTKIWGRPKEALEVQLITDSQASILMVENVDRKVGMQALLRPDWDVVMEVWQQRKQNTHSSMTVHKVKSHISVEEAPDELFWNLNEEADRLATLARGEVEHGRYKPTTPGFFPGSKVACCINGQICHTKLKDKIHEAATLGELQDFLCRKYGWTTRMFDMVDWSAHNCALKKYPLLQTVTVMKFIHGWLATMKKRSTIGEVATPLCMLCGDEENNLHIYSCQFETIRAARDNQWRKLDEVVKNLSTPDVGAAFSVGMRSVTGKIDMKMYRKEFSASKELDKALQSQEQIGWNHFMFGRISKYWQEIGPTTEYIERPEIWATKIVNAVITFGITLWKKRNQIIHGNDGGISKLVLQKTEMTIRTLYDEICPTCHPSHQWLFQTLLEERLRETHPVQIAWIDSIRRIYPSRFKDATTRMGQVVFPAAEIEYIKAPGQTV